MINVSLRYLRLCGVATIWLYITLTVDSAVWSALVYNLELDIVKCNNKTTDHMVAILVIICPAIRQNIAVIHHNQLNSWTLWPSKY